MVAGRATQGGIGDLGGRDATDDLRERGESSRLRLRAARTVHGAVRRAVHSAVHRAVHGAVCRAVHSAVDSAIRHAVCRAVHYAVESCSV